MASPCARRVGDVAPYQGCGQDVGMVGADVPAARVPVCVPVVVPVCAARRGRARTGRGMVGADVPGGPRARVRP